MNKAFLGAVLLFLFGSAWTQFDSIYFDTLSGYSYYKMVRGDFVNSNTTDFTNALAGKVPGLRIISSSGSAGASTYLNIRGASSVLGNNQPLIVLDGHPVYSLGGVYGNGGVDLSNRTIDLDPDIFESITVLPSGPATIRFGVLGGNGAIVIETRPVKLVPEQSFDVSFGSSVSFSTVNKMHGLNETYAQGSSGSWTEGSSWSWGPRMDALYYYRPPEWANASYIWNPNGWLAERGDPGLDPLYLTNEKAMHFDRNSFFETGIKYKNSISLSGKTKNIGYFMSAGLLDETGVIPGNRIRRNNFLFKVNSRLTRKFSLSAQIYYASTGGDRQQRGANVSGVMLGLTRTPPSFDNAAGYIFPDGTQRNYRGSGTRAGLYDNPYWAVKENLFSDRTNRVAMMSRLEAELAKDLNLCFTMGSDFYYYQSVDFLNIGSGAYQSYQGADAGGYYENGTANGKNLSADLNLSYSRSFSRDLRIDLLGGVNLFQSKQHDLFAQAYGLEIPGFSQLGNASYQDAAEETTQFRLGSFYSGASFLVLNALSLSGGIRNEWSTLLYPGHDADLYYHLNAAFLFTGLNILNDIPLLESGKIRIAYSRLANPGLMYKGSDVWASAEIMDGWTGGIKFPFRGTPGYLLNSKANAKLRNEHLNNLEFGLDLILLDNRLGISQTWFRNRSEDLFINPGLAPSNGSLAMFRNEASMECNGYETMLNILPFQLPRFGWSFTINLTGYSNRVTELPSTMEYVLLGGFNQPQIRAVEGEEYPVIYGYDFWRDDNGNLVINNDPMDGYEDGFPMGRNDKMQYLGKVHPDYTLGLFNEFRFLGFRLAVLFDIRKGGYMWNGTRGALRYFGAHADTENREDEGFVFDGVAGRLDFNEEGFYVVSGGSRNTIGVKKDQDWYTSGEGSGFTGPTQTIEETSSYRLREIKFAYTFREIPVDFIDHAKLYFMGRNLWLSTPYEGIDPETSFFGSSNVQGLEYFNMPGTRSYTMGLVVNF